MDNSKFDNDLEAREALEQEQETRTRDNRKVIYERQTETKIPDEVIAKFAADGWSLALKLYRLGNEVQNSRVATKLKEGWEFVTSDELSDDYAAFFEQEKYRGRSEALVVKDLVLMKASLELVASRREYYDNLARQELNAVDVNVLEKKGFKNLGSKSTVTMAEPKFRN